MRRYSTLCLLLLFFTVSITRADDIATIQAFLDNKTDDEKVLHSVYAACLSLTRTGTEEAVPVLKKLLDDERFSTVARTALTNLSGEAKEKMLRESPKTLDRAGEIALLKQLLETADNKETFQKLQRAILELKSKDTGKIVLDNIGKLPPEKQAALILNLGVRKDDDLVPRLIKLTGSDQPAIRLAAVQALGEIGDVTALDTLLLAAAGADTELAKTATENLKHFTGDEFDKKIIALLDSAQIDNDSKTLRLAALDVIGKRQITAASDRLRNWDYLEVSDIEIRMAAMRAFAQSAPPTVENIHFLLRMLEALQRMNKITDDEEAFTREALLILCRRTDNRDGAVNLFMESMNKDEHVYLHLLGSFYLDCLFQLGGEKAAACLADVAMGTDDALTDKATQLLGRWTTPEVAPYLIDLAEKHPNERYRSRTLSGYLRVIRQMGLPVEQKIQMAEKAVAAARRDADKERAMEVLNRFKTMAKGTPIFDGKTFDGWEFRGNEKWFRIADGAIVCGSLDENIPHNEFITTKKEYSDFTLRVECKVIGQGANGGVQFRSVRAPADGNMPNEMMGYQADMTETANYWGALYDESRRNRFLAEPKKELIESVFRPNDWNEYEIVCKGNNIKLYLNGTLTVDYTETESDIPAHGFIGLQIHGGPPSETWYRNIRIVTEGIVTEEVQYISYGQYGAVGDGVTDDFEAIIKAHDAANQAGLPVKADAGATYYIGSANKTAVIQTNTDWNNAKFIIDDTKVEIRNNHVFSISSKLPAVRITTVPTLKKNQTKLDLLLPQDSFIEVTDNKTMRYLREGANQNNGTAQTDVFVVDKEGNVDKNTPIIWDFDTISEMTAYPIDTETLTVKGGHFTTIANQAESRYTYHNRGLGITRSNVVIDGVYHAVTGELDHGAPYSGFMVVSKCTNVMVQNCTFTGHKVYSTIGNANVPVSMGSYDITVNKANNITFKNCKQTNDIHDSKQWGVFGSNHSKNLTFDTVEFSRFDAHMGVTNATIKNSVLGHQGINLIGRGFFLVENTKVCGWTFINLRSDYGSTFDGEIIIRHCEFLPRNGLPSDAVLVSGSYSGQHDFGYPCSMPKKITIEGLVIDDSNPPNEYPGPKIFADFNGAYTNEDYVEKYPYVITKEAVVGNLTIKSGKPYNVSTNPFMFRNVKITEK